MGLAIYLYEDIQDKMKELEQKRSDSLKEAGDNNGLIPMIMEYYESRKPEQEEALYQGGTTHNLATMAAEAGLYKCLWRHEEIGIFKAGKMIDILKDGLNKLKNNPQYYEKFNAKNGWGLYEHFVPFVENYLNACIQYPEATIYASR